MVHYHDHVAGLDAGEARVVTAEGGPRGQERQQYPWAHPRLLGMHLLENSFRDVV